MLDDYKALYNYVKMKADMEPESDAKAMLHLLNDIRKEHEFNIKHRKHNKSGKDGEKEDTMK